MKKYVIKNCSASVEYSNGAGKFIYCSCKDKLCENINDCTIKQIVESCNDVLEQETDPLNSSEMSFARKILDFLGIEKVNE